MLTGLVTCTRCGLRFRGRTSTNSKGYTYNYYTDAGFHTRGKHVCHRFSIPRSRLESFILKQVKSRVLILRREGHLERQLRRLLKSKKSGGPPAQELRASEERVADIEARIVRIMDLCEMGGVTAEEAHLRLKALRAEKTQLEMLESNGEHQLSSEEIDDAVKEMLGYLDDYEEIVKKAKPEELKQHLKGVVHRIEVDSRVPQATCYFYKLPVPSSPVCALRQPRRAVYEHTGRD